MHHRQVIVMDAVRGPVTAVTNSVQERERGIHLYLLIIVVR